MYKRKFSEHCSLQSSLNNVWNKQAMTNDDGITAYRSHSKELRATAATVASLAPCSCSTLPQRAVTYIRLSSSVGSCFNTSPRQNLI